MKLISHAVLFSTVLIVQLGAWTPFSDVKLAGVDGKQAVPVKLETCFDGRLETTARFNWLNSSEVMLDFEKPVRMGSLVLIQSNAMDRARPAALEVSINDRFVRLARLADAPGEIQKIPINEIVSQLKLRVGAVHTQNKFQQGSIGEIGYTTDYVASVAKTIPAVTGASLPAVSGDKQRPLKIIPWETSGFFITASNGKQKPVSKLNAIFDPKRGQVTFNPLKGSRIKVEFEEPRRIALFAFQQGKSSNWARVHELGVSVDGGPERIFLFENTAETQAIPINATARELVFSVKSVHTGKGIMAWGGFSQFGAGEFEPVIYSTASEPLPMMAEAVEFVVESKRAMMVPLTAHIASYRLLYRGPELAIKPGRRTYRVNVKDFRETSAFGLDWRACHIRDINFNIDPAEVDPGFKLVSAKAVLPSGAPVDAWYDLGKFDPPVKEIGGKKWTEGMSYSSSGRFGNSTYNGLLSEVVGDLWFHTYTAGARDQLRRQKFDLYIAGNEPGGEGQDSAQSWRINGINIDGREAISNSWTHMSRRMPLKAGAELTWLASTLAPGFLGDCNKPLTISSRGGGDIPKRSGAPDEDEQRFFLDALRDGKTRKIGPTLVITPDGVVSGPGEVQMEKLSAPWIVAVWGGFKRPAFWGDKATAVLFTLDKGKVSWDKEGVNLPAGRFGVSSSFHGLFHDDWREENVRRRAALLCGMLRNYPFECKEYYRVEGDTLHIYNEFRYEAWGDPRFRAADFAPLPPIFTWANLSSRWGALPLDRERMIRTPAGPYSWNPGKSVSYTLPVPVNRHAAFPRNPDFEKENREMAEKFLAQPEPEVENYHRIADAWRTSYTPLRVGSSLLGMSYLGDEFRDRVLKTLKLTTGNAFRDFAWVPRREQFSKRPYLSSLWVDDKVSPAMYGDINSGIGAANYGLYAYSKYSGDWEHARKLWPRVMDSIRFCEVVNDWAIPMTSAREGILFGGIDMDTIGYLGVSAVEQMARQLGTKAELDRLIYLRSKLAPSVALRMTFQNYLDPKGEYPRLWVNGFSESGPNLEWAVSESGVGLDHNAMMYCWQGQQPEMYQFLMQLPGREVMTTLQKVLMDQYFTGENFSGWRKMPFNHTRTAAHLAMRSWLPGWNRAELERDCGIWLERTPKELNAYNSGFFGVYQGSVDRVFLVNWEPASLGMLTYDREQRQLTAELQSDRPFTLEGAAPGKVTAILIDGKPIALPTVRYDGEYFSLMMPPCHGKVVLTFAR